MLKRDNNYAANRSSHALKFGIRQSMEIAHTLIHGHLNIS
jgi:hypothetical protein